MTALQDNTYIKYRFASETRGEFETARCRNFFKMRMMPIDRCCLVLLVATLALCRAFYIRATEPISLASLKGRIHSRIYGFHREHSKGMEARVYPPRVAHTVTSWRPFGATARRFGGLQRVHGAKTIEYPPSQASSQRPVHTSNSSKALAAIADEKEVIAGLIEEDPAALVASKELRGFQRAYNVKPRKGLPSQIMVSVPVVYDEKESYSRYTNVSSQLAKDMYGRVSALEEEGNSSLIVSNRYIQVDDNIDQPRTLLEKYSQFTKDNYLAMAFVQSGVIACGADIITQKLAGANQVDYAHVLGIMAVAATASGSMNAFFLRKLENAFPGSATKEVATKAIISTLFLGGAINAAYLVGVPLLSSTIFAQGGAARLPPMDAATIFKGWTKKEFLTLTKIECLMFLPYHSLAFKVVPPQLRPLTQAGMAGTFNVAVSAVTLGYFNVWCERVLNNFGS